MSESREMTVDEVREQFLSHVREMVLYWWREDRVPPIGKLSGLAHSILVALDGESDLPAFAVVPNPHPDDREFYQREGENWYPSPPCNLNNVNIAGPLHERLYDAAFEERLARYGYER